MIDPIFRYDKIDDQKWTEKLLTREPSKRFVRWTEMAGACLTGRAIILHVGSSILLEEDSRTGRNGTELNCRNMQEIHIPYGHHKVNHNNMPDSAN